MYEEFYGFSERPFQLTPDPAVTIRSGDWVEVDPAAGEVRLWR